MLAITLFLLLMPSMIRTRGTSSIYNSPNMDSICDRTISLNGEKLPGIFFSLTSGNYPQNFNCLLTIQGFTINQRIIIVIEKMDIACGGDRLLIYDGKREPGSILNKDESLQCGMRKYYLRTANSNTVIIEFISNNDGRVGNGFILNAAIHFPVSTCSHSDGLYRCRNSYCISNLFNCDDRNWCGDNTQRYVCR